MRVFTIISLFLFVNFAVAQTKVTDYPFQAQNGVSNIQFLDSLNGNIIFYALDVEGGGIWRTNGTPEGTLKINSETNSISSLNVSQVYKNSGFLYFTLPNQYALYRTDGETLETVETGGVKQVLSNGEYLMYLKYTKDYPVSDLYLIKNNEPPIKVDEQVIYLTANKNNSYYIKYKAEENTTQIIKFDTLQSTDIITVMGYSSSYGFYHYEEYTDIIFRNINNYFLYRIYPDNSFDFKDLGSIEVNYIPFANNAQEDKYYLQANTNEIAFYRVNNIATPAYIVPLSNIKTILNDLYKPVGCCSGIGIWSYNVVNDRLIMQLTIGSEGISSWQLAEYDFNTTKSRVSKNLISYTFPDRNPEVKVIDNEANTYEIKGYQTLTYNFALDSVISVKNKEVIVDSLQLVNFRNKILEFSDNIYQLDNGSKTTFIEQDRKAVFNSEPLDYFVNGDTLQLLHYDYDKKEIQYWISDGISKNQQLFADNLNNTSIFLGKYPLAVKYITFTELEITLFFGTKKTIAHFVSDQYLNVNKVSRNNKEAIIQIWGPTGMVFLRVDNLGVVTYIKFPTYEPKIYQTEHYSYLLDPYAQKLYGFGKESLTLLSENISNLAYIKANKLFFAKRQIGLSSVVYSSLNYIEAYEKEKVLKQANFNNFQVEGKYLAFGLDIYNLETEKFVYLGKGYSINAISQAKVIGERLYYFGNALFEITDNKFREIDVPGIVYDVQGYFNGLAISAFTSDNTSSLYYYDLNKSELIRIIKETNINPQVSSSSPIISSNNTYWDARTRSFLKFTGGDHEAPILTSSKAVVTQDFSGLINGYAKKIFKRIDNTLVKETEFLSELAEKIDDKFFFTKSSPASGIELAYFHIDSIFEFNEIISGREGIIAPKVFTFKNNLYVNCFTYRYGWQIWNMGEIKPYAGSDQNGLILGTAAFENQLIAYPNPVENQINFTENVTGNIIISDITGRVVLNETIVKQNFLDVSKLQKGKYIINLVDDKGKTGIPFIRY